MMKPIVPHTRLPASSGLLNPGDATGARQHGALTAWLAQ